MQDRFRFRFWNKKRKMYYAEQDVERCSVWVGFKTGVGCVLDGGDEYIIEQCTGLKDKNGKLIYEGDIVKTEWFDEKTIYQVVWDEKMACFYFDSKDMFYLFDDLPAEVTEIIGNIDENPELLEVQDD